MTEEKTENRGRPPVSEDEEIVLVQLFVPVSMKEYLKSQPINMSAYIRQLVEADMQTNSAE